MENYLLQCKQLSLTARMAIGLLVFERYCEEREIHGYLITDLLVYLWKWPVIDGPDQFQPWEQSRPELANYGLGDEASQQLKLALKAVNVDDSEFRQMVSNLVELLWGSFWGAAEDEQSMRQLANILYLSQLIDLPPLTPFKCSRFSDEHGWGQKMTQEDCDYWRRSFK